MLRWAWLTQSGHPTSSEAPRAHVYTQIQLQKMPKLTKQAFFPCNLHTVVRSATVCAAPATPGAAQSGLGSSRLLGGSRDTSALLTKHGFPSNARLCQKETPPAECNHGLGPGVRSFQPQAPIVVPKTAHACRDRHPRSPSGTWGAAGWGGGPAAPVFLAEEHPHDRDGHWLCGPARAAGGARLSARVWQSFV